MSAAAAGVSHTVDMVLHAIGSKDFFLVRQDSSKNSNFDTIVGKKYPGLSFLYAWVPLCSGRHFRTKLMSRYIGAGPNDRFDVRIQKLKILGNFWGKNVFQGPFLGFFLVAWPFLNQSA